MPQRVFCSTATSTSGLAWLTSWPRERLGIPPIRSSLPSAARRTILGCLSSPRFSKPTGGYAIWIWHPQAASQAVKALDHPSAAPIYTQDGEKLFLCGISPWESGYRAKNVFFKTNELVSKVLITKLTDIIARPEAALNDQDCIKTREQTAIQGRLSNTWHSSDQTINKQSILAKVSQNLNIQ